jgi:hypothetical protein
MTPETRTAEQVEADLAAPFDPSKLRFKPAVVNGNRALALVYVDARCIMDRLDEAVGVSGWQDEYQFLPDGSCLCKLSVFIAGAWVVKMDVGGESEQKDDGDRHKAAVSDALKRVAVKFGVGRYLYGLPQIWCDYDPVKKKFTTPPTLPVTAVPRPSPKKTGASPKGEVLDAGLILRRVKATEQVLIGERAIAPGDLVKALQTRAVASGLPSGVAADLTKWPPAVLAKVGGWVVEEKARLQTRKAS